MRPNVLIQRLPSLVALVAIVGASGCADERKGPAQGSLDGKCYPNGTCDPGLMCQDNGTTNVCVEAPAEGSIGGVCYGNGTCDPGLVCNGSTCEADTAIPTGTLGGPCYGNGTCMGSDLICVADVCEVNNAPRVGLLGGACYDNGSCNPGLLCNSGVCEEDDTIASGELGGACLVNGTCREGLLCNGTVCEVDDTLAVGTVGAACFPNGTCNAGLECIVTVDAGESSAECAVEEPIDFGALDQPCWPNNTCNGGLVCDFGTCVDNDSAITEPPGQDGGLCYHNGTCNDGLVCNSFGVCEPIVDGALFGECLAGDACNLGLSCYDGICLPTIEHLGSIHGVVTDYIDNARLENVQVTLIHQGGVEQTVSDALGYYQFDDLLPGHFEVTFLSLDDAHTTRRLRDVTVTCNNLVNIFCDECDDAWPIDQDRHCNQIHDIRLFPFSGRDSCKVWYVGDQEVVPAPDVQIIADYTGICGVSESECWNDYKSRGYSEIEIASVCSEGARRSGNNAVDISPDRFFTSTDDSGSFDFANLPNTGELGVYFYVMPSQHNGFDYETKKFHRMLDVWVGSNELFSGSPDGPQYNENDNDDHLDDGPCEIFLSPTVNRPFLVLNNWEDYRTGGYDVTEAVTGTFSRAMKTWGCDIGLHYDDDNNVTTPPKHVDGEVSWDETATTFTFEPYSYLHTNTKYVVHIENCESQLDDQLYWALNDPYDSDRHSFETQDGISQLAGVWECMYGTVGADDNFEFIFDMPIDVSAPETFFQFFRVIGDYPDHHDPDISCADEAEYPVAATFTADGNVLTVDPDATLVAGESYYIRAVVCSSIPGDCLELDRKATDGNCGGICVNVEPQEMLWFLFADIPYTGAGLPTLLDPTANITLTFSKPINPALSVITIEDADGFVDHDNDDQTQELMTSAFSVDGNNAILDPAFDLEVGHTYVVRYQAFSADEQGYANGHFEFRVQDEPRTFAFVDDNLGDRTAFDYLSDIVLTYSDDVDDSDPAHVDDHDDWNTSDDNRTLVDLTDENGRSVKIHDIWTDGKDLYIDAALSPDTTYVLHVKAYRDDVADEGPESADNDFPPGTNNQGSGVGIYVQHTITFTTRQHITLVSTSFGTYTGGGNGFYDDGEQDECELIKDATGNPTEYDCEAFKGNANFPATGTAITLTFTVPPDVGPGIYHAINFTRLYRVAEANATHPYAGLDLVATNNVVNADTSTVTLSLLPDEVLQEGASYCVAYQVTSDITYIDDDGKEQEDISEDIGNLGTDGNLDDLPGDADEPEVGYGPDMEMCFRVAGVQVTNPTAPTAAPTLLLVNLVDSDDQGVTLRWNVLQGAAGGNVGAGTRWYEFYVSATDSNVDDFLLWKTVEDCQIDGQPSSQPETDNCVAANTNLGQATDGATRPGLNVLGQDLWGYVCNDSSSPDAPAYCNDGYPFDQGGVVYFRVRACTGSIGTDVDPLCGPYSAALEVRDNVGPRVVAVVQWDVLDPFATTVFQAGGEGAACTATTTNCGIFNGEEDEDVNDPTDGPRSADNVEEGNDDARLGLLVFYDEATVGGTGQVTITGVDPNAGALTGCTTQWNLAEVTVDDGDDFETVWPPNTIAYVQCNLDPATQNGLGVEDDESVLGEESDDINILGPAGAGGAAAVLYTGFNFDAPCHCHVNELLVSTDESHMCDVGQELACPTPQ